jgi:hypothetical protein
MLTLTSLRFKPQIYKICGTATAHILRNWQPQQFGHILHNGIRAI